MRPEILFPLFVPVTKLPGIGPRLGVLVEKLAGPHVVDLLWHLPVSLIDRSFAPKLAEAPIGRIVTLTIIIESHMAPDSPRRPFRVLARDETGFVTLVFFHARAEWLQKLLPVGETRIVSGTLEEFQGGLQMTHPDRISRVEDWDEGTELEAIYPMTGGLQPKVLAKGIKGALERMPDLAEWDDPTFVERRNWPSWREALQLAHGPQGEDDLSPLTLCRQRLAYDELLANQVALALVRANLRRRKGRSFAAPHHLRRRVLEALPFALTAAQTRSLAEIDADMASDSRMLRLLQGDVGAGKTVVALLAMLNAVETGAQAALMAPTEILARQHVATLQPLAEAIGVKVGLLTGRDKGKSRQIVLDGLASGEIDIAIGTHALFQEAVVFRDLGLAVIDEQHRFGVQQRLDLAAKGRGVDMLVMTATPIPRTLTLTAYGDMDVSRLDGKPPGRQPIDTRVLPLSRLDEVASGLGRAMQGGNKVYWICPLVEESEVSDLAAAEQRFHDLAGRFGDKVALVHGRMKGPEKDAAMESFAKGKADLLVATTVVEVGVDVREAGVIVIEHAERFGLAQLHQLRGRVGRGDRPSTCLLLYGGPLSETGRARLNILRESEDGFRIAEEDLRLRGGGDILGRKQSGLPDFRLADLAVHGDLLEVARDDAKLVLDRDPGLTSPRGQALRVLLYLFERDNAVTTLRSG